MKQATNASLKSWFQRENASFLIGQRVLVKFLER
jgi:hypothetical protein